MFGEENVWSILTLVGLPNTCKVFVAHRLLIYMFSGDPVEILIYSCNGFILDINSLNSMAGSLMTFRHLLKILPIH